MPVPILALAAGGYLLTKGKGLKGGIKQLTNTKTGIAASAVAGFGTGTAVNVIDKKFLGGRITSVGVQLGNVAGKAINLNGTDAITYYITNGGIKTDKKSLMKGGLVLFFKKLAEVNDWIDPPVSVSVGNNTYSADVGSGGSSSWGYTSSGGVS